MLPIRDDIPSRRTPVVNYALMGACTVVFLLQLSAAGSGASLAERFGMIPQRVLNPDKPVMIPTEVLKPVGQDAQGRVIAQRTRGERPAAETSINPWLTLVTCVFLHGGWMHFLGNMWFLYIFGDNVEDCLGHGKYLLFYLATGVAASATHLVTNSASAIPTIGASGAIAGVMGAYLLLYPRARVLAIVPLFVIFYSIVVPAPVFLGIWFFLQFFQGVAALGAVQTAGVAWWAHIGGFVAGAVAVLGLRKSGSLNECVAERRPTSPGTTVPWGQRHQSGDTSGHVTGSRRGQRQTSNDPFADDGFFK